MGICERCGKETDRLYTAFGKKICRECVDSRPKKGTGNSGMTESPQLEMCFSTGINLRKCKKSDKLFGNLYFSHYPGSKGIVGRSINYIVENNGMVAGIIGFSSPPKNYTIFKEYFLGADETMFVINNVFRLTMHEKNLATRVMKLARNTIKQDYKDKYGDTLLGIVTFVEPPRTGALYKADNWDYLGLSQGIRMRRTEFDKIFTKGIQKHIFGYKYKVGK